MFTGRLLCNSLDLQGCRVRDTEQHLGLVPECAESSLLSDSLGLERSSDLADLSGHSRAGDDGAGAALGHLRAGEDEAYSVSAYVSGSSRAWSGPRFGGEKVMCERGGRMFDVAKKCSGREESGRSARRRSDLPDRTVFLVDGLGLFGNGQTLACGSARRDRGRDATYR